MANVDFTKDDLFYLLGRKTAEVETLTVMLEQARATIATLTPSADAPPVESAPPPVDRKG